MCVCAVFQSGATCYQASSVPWDAGILERHRLRMLTIQVKFILPSDHVSHAMCYVSVSIMRRSAVAPVLLLHPLYALRLEPK